MGLADAPGEPGADRDIRKGGEIFPKTDLGDLERNMRGGNPVSQSLDLKKQQQQTLSEDEDVWQEMVPMKFTQISFSNTKTLTWLRSRT